MSARKALVNAARGETALMIDGQARTLCLTLGALARLEAAFDVVSLSELAVRLQHMSAGDLLIVLAALMNEETSVADLARADIDLRDAAAAVTAAFRLALDDAR
jgi:hypothetical protein